MVTVQISDDLFARVQQQANDSEHHISAEIAMMLILGLDTFAARVAQYVVGVSEEDPRPVDTSWLDGPVDETRYYMKRR